MSIWRQLGRKRAPSDGDREPSLYDPLTELPGRLLFRDRPEDVIQNADVAVHRAKENGSASYEVFRQEMATHPATRLDLEAELRQAVANGDLVVEYQPEVELSGGRIVAVHALLRWNHPERGEVEPSEF